MGCCTSPCTLENSAFPRKKFWNWGAIVKEARFTIFVWSPSILTSIPAKHSRFEITTQAFSYRYGTYRYLWNRASFYTVITRSNFTTMISSRRLLGLYVLAMALVLDEVSARLSISPRRAVGRSAPSRKLKADGRPSSAKVKPHCLKIANFTKLFENDDGYYGDDFWNACREYWLLVGPTASPSISAKPSTKPSLQPSASK